MRNLLRVVLSGIFLGISAGCAVMTSQHEVGLKPCKLKAEKLNGAWYNNETVCWIDVKEPDLGIIRVAFVEHKNDDFVLKKFDVRLRQGKEFVFGNCLYQDVTDKKDIDKKYVDTWFWFVLDYNRSKMVIFFPKAELFKELVKKGKLKGNIDDNDVIITEPTEAITKFVESNGKDGNLFNWKDPAVFIRLINK